MRTLGWLSRFIPLALVAALTLLSGCQGGEPVDGPSLIRSQAWRLDETGQATLQDAQAAIDWQPLIGWKSWGFGAGAVWLRIELASAGPEARLPWVVRVRPPFTDYLTLYDPVAGLVLRAGRALPAGDDSLAETSFALPIPALPQARVIYLQIRSSSARTAQIDVMPLGQEQRSSRIREWQIGLALAMSCVFAALASVQWWFSREPIVGVFALKQVMASAWAFSMLGFARIMVGPLLQEGVLSTITACIFSWTIASTLWFLGMFLATYQPSRSALLACRTLAGGMVLWPAALWLVTLQTVLVTANIVVLVGLALILLTAISAHDSTLQPPIPLKALLVYLVFYAGLNSLLPLCSLGMAVGPSWAAFGSLGHVVLDGFLMFAMLQVHARITRRRQQQVALELERSKQKLQAEERHNSEQSQLFAMLAHEMKTPLATLRMWLELGPKGHQKMERAISDMNIIIERCIHTGQLADKALQPNLQRLDPRTLTRECIDNCRAPERVDLDAVTDGAFVRTDAQILSIALGNLLDNACKYSVPGSRIKCSLSPRIEQGQAGWQWRVESVCDAGALPDGERVFEKYYRTAAARRVSGSGLGLFLVRGLLNLLQGQIHYQAMGDRVVFTFWIPGAAA